jgi:hypothetical protein
VRYNLIKELPNGDRMVRHAECSARSRSRRSKNLAHSDTGIVILRRLLREQLERVEHGLDPINVIDEPTANKRIPTGAWNTILSPTEAAALPCD